MASITGFTEQWNLHRYNEVEDFIKEHIEKLKDIEKGKTVKGYVDEKVEVVDSKITEIDNKLTWEK